MPDRTDESRACLDCPAEIQLLPEHRGRPPLRCPTCRPVHRRELSTQRCRRSRALDPERVRARGRAQYAANPGARREATRQWKQRNPDHDREYYLRNQERYKANGRRWREENPEHMAELRRAWAATHREHLREYMERYRVENCEHLLECSRRWRDATRDRRREQDRARRAANPDKARAANARRFAATHGVNAELISPLEVFERDVWLCQLCGTEVAAGLRWPEKLSPSIDHIVPLSLGGPHVLGNVQLAHLVCNMRKNNDPTRAIEPPM